MSLNLTRYLINGKPSQKKKRVLFCYFSMKNSHYTPLDIGYILALIKKKGLAGYDCSMIELPMSFAARDKSFKEETDLVLSHNPDAVFFFLDNVLWSKIFSLGRAKKIADKLKNIMADVFVGFQSYKFYPESIEEILSLGAVDCVIGDGPEGSFLHLDEILEKKYVAGVFYPKKINKKIFSGKNKKPERSDLDYLPSPYLTHVMDGFLRKKQEESPGGFDAFICSSRGCRFGCYYCFRSVKFEKVRFFSVKRFYDEVEYLNSNFGMFKFIVLDDDFIFSKNRLREFYTEFEKRKSANPVLDKNRFFIMARPESLIDEEIIELLVQINVAWVQAGLQTVNPALQKYMNREFPIDKFKHIADLLKKHGIKLFLDIIAGLPNDDIDHLKKTLDYAIGLDPQEIQIKQFFLNPETLFFVKKEDYQIEIEDKKRDFEAPYVLETIGGLGEEYHKEAHAYILENIKKNPQIKWRFLSKKGNYFSLNKG